MAFRKKPAKPAKQTSASASRETMTLMQHLDELKGRLFWVAVVFIVASACVYPLYDTVIALITAPLGGHELYYFTVTGGLSFIIKVCMYVGVIAAIPALVYHLYRFISPVMTKNRLRNVVIYTLSSAILGVAGIVFSYYVILPAAIKFLTNFTIGPISSMLSVDSYVSFVIAYLIAGALLFQLPVILLALNTIHPLRPRKLLGQERYVIVGAFIFAALLSPTPDAFNQALMAAPIILMYQVGIILVWNAQRRARRKQLRLEKRQRRKEAKAAASATGSKAPVAAVPARAVPRSAAAAPQMGTSILSSAPMSFTAADIRPATHGRVAPASISGVSGMSPAKPLSKHIAPIPHPRRALKRPPIVASPKSTSAAAPQKQSLSHSSQAITAALPAQPVSPRPSAMAAPRPRPAVPVRSLQRTPTSVQTQTMHRTLAAPSPVVTRPPRSHAPSRTMPSSPRRGLDGFGVYASA